MDASHAALKPGRLTHGRSAGAPAATQSATEVDCPGCTQQGEGSWNINGWRGSLTGHQLD
jgi:hypothetical protein